MNRINLSAFVLCVSLCAGAAFAGAKYTGDGHVWITKNDDGTGSASGYLGMIYNRPDNEWIGCQKSSTNLIMCHAKNTANQFADCWASSAFLANAISSVSPDARLVFRFDAGGKCTQITVQHSSAYEDKQ
jgi:hypothetical protein